MCVWVGYVADHAAGTHRILSPATKKLSLTRDVIFLRQSYGNWKEKKELDKNHNIEAAPIIMLKNAEEDDFCEEIRLPI